MKILFVLLFLITMFGFSSISDAKNHQNIFLKNSFNVSSLEGVSVSEIEKRKKDNQKSDYNSDEWETDPDTDVYDIAK